MANDKDFKVKNGLDVGSSTNHTVTLNAYGTGTNTGLPAQALNVDENGNVIEVDAGVLPFVVHNDTGATLVKGTVVYVSGLNGNTPEVSLARANSSSTMPAYGLVEEDIADTEDGTVVTFGSLKGLDVSDFGETGITFSLGDTVYISSSEAGKLTNVAPTGEANFIQNIGKIERASPTTNMTIKVGGAGRTNATPNLNDGNFFLGNSSNQAVPADFTGSIDSHLNQENPTDGYVLSWTSGDYAWVAQSGGGGGSSTFAGLTEANLADVDLHDVALQAKTTYVVTAPSSNEYRFDINGTDNNPTIYVRAGETIAFDLTALAGNHPFQIEDNAGSAYSTGLVHIATDGTRTTGASAQGKTSGTLYWKVPASINGTYEYQCTSHGGMNGDIIVTPDSAAGGLQTEEHPTVTNGSATVTLSASRTLSQIEVYLNGVKLRGGTTLGGTTEWTVSGTTLTFNQNLSTGDEVTVVSLVTATDATLASLSDTNVTGVSDGELLRYDNSTSKYVPTSMVETSAGNVGIGTTSPTSQLSFGPTIGRDFAVYEGANGANKYGIGMSGDGSGGDPFRTKIYANGVENVSITSDGNVGIGTSTPPYKLDVVGNVNGSHVSRVNNISTGSTSQSFLQLAAGGRYTNLRTNYTGQYFQISGSNIPSFYQDFDTYFFRNSAGTNHMVLNSSGKLLIGYSSNNGPYKLQVNSQIFATSGTIATSDQRYKENITPLTGAIDTVKALNPVQFDWKEHPVHEFDRSAPTTGFIAQEVQTALADKPWLNSLIKSNNVVIEPEQTDEDGNVIAEAVSEDFLGIAEGNLIAVLTAAIQEQQTQIETQQATIEALEARLTALEGGS